MKTMKTIMSALSVAALLALSACSSEVEESSAVVEPAIGKVISYTVDVRHGGPETRATVDNELNLLFEEGDQLEISGENISGTLTLKSGAGTKNATFSGNLTYTGEGEAPADDLELNARLIGVDNVLDYSIIEILKCNSASVYRGYFMQTRRAFTFPETLEEAVRKYSDIVGTATYGNKSFSLKQNAFFVELDLTFKLGQPDDVILDFDFYYNIGPRPQVKLTDGRIHGWVAFAIDPDMDHFGRNSVELCNTSEEVIKKIELVPSSTKAEAGKVYHLTRLIEGDPIDLSSQTGDVTVADKIATTISGTNTSLNITVGNGATVTLKDASFNRLTTQGDATIILDGTNRLNFDAGGSAVTIAAGSTLTIKGDGSLTSGTGWSKSKSGLSGDGNLIVEGGTITMNGNDLESGTTGVGISVRNFTLKGGKVNAWGGNNSYYSENRNEAIYASGDIVIEGGEVDSNGRHGMYAAGNMTISGGTVKAVGSGSYSGYNSGLSAAGTLTISGGTVTAKGAGESPGIGDRGTCGDILISGGTVTATGGGGAAGIGTGSSAGSRCGNITIKSTVTEVTATKGSGATESIGHGNASSTVGTVTIESGANVVQN
ncbi:MAG: hypothetical protein IJ562_09615 [Prevotella sp.]|nr:hypothetical protein [Prevotella sp.]